MSDSIDTPKTMQALAVTGRRELSRRNESIPSCGPGQALVRVAYTGICGSDIPRYFDGTVHAYPQVLGHEFSGTVVALGPETDGATTGERVAVAPLVPCGDCDQCRIGRPSLCPRYSFIGSRQPGALAEYVLVPASNLVPIGTLGLREAALLEPMSVAVHGIDRVGTHNVRSAAVLGGGVIGLMSVITLRARGVSEITVVDLDDRVLDVARTLGATRVVNAARTDVASAFGEGRAPEVVIESAGSVPTRLQALDIAAKGGSIVFVGTPSAPLELDVRRFEQILRKELILAGSWMSYSSPFPGQEWEEARRLLEQAGDAVASLITHEFELQDAESGFAAMRESSSMRLKVLFRIGGES